MSPYFLSSTLRFERITKGDVYNPRKYMALSKLQVCPLISYYNGK